MTEAAGIVEAYDPALQRGRILADAQLYHFGAVDWILGPPVPPRPRMRVTFTPGGRRALRVRPRPLQRPASDDDD